MCLNFASPALQARPGVEAAAPLKRCPTPPLGSLQSATARISQPNETQKGCQFALNMFKMQVTAAIARREFVYSRGKRVGAAQFCMGPRKPAGQLQGANVYQTFFRRKELHLCGDPTSPAPAALGK